MDFGRVPEEQLPPIDFKLAKEPYWNAGVLPGVAVAQPAVYVGCPRWGLKEWVGKLYPPGTRDANFLDEYIRQFNAIELHATHYKLYDAAAIKKWADKAGDSPFLFCPKVYNGISHTGTLSDKNFLTEIFLAGIAAFGNHLGPVLLQLSDKFGPDRKQELFNYLQSLPTDINFFLELRHPDWFVEPHLQDLLHQLKKLQTGFVITDAAGRRDCCHLHLTQPKAFIRFAGNNLHPTDFTRIDDWVKRLAYWFSEGLTAVYFFIHLPDESLAPELAIYLIDKLNETCGLNLKKPVLVKGLFD